MDQRRNRQLLKTWLIAMADVLDILRQGYADTFSELDDSACYNFLQPEWISDSRTAVQSVHIIGDHGDFIAERVAGVVEEIIEIDDRVRFVFGRENWPVMYVETSETEPVLQALEDAYTTKHTVIHQDDPIGWYKDEDETHGACPHAVGDAPVFESGWPTRNTDVRDVSYIRALWQD